MQGLPVTSYGILIRKQALKTHRISIQQLLDQTAHIYAENQRLVSLGPYQSIEAQHPVCKQLEEAGLRYGIDFIHLDHDIPAQVTMHMDVHED